MNNLIPVKKKEDEWKKNVLLNSTLMVLAATITLMVLYMMFP